MGVSKKDLVRQGRLKKVRKTRKDGVRTTVYVKNVPVPHPSPKTVTVPVSTPSRVGSLSQNARVLAADDLRASVADYRNPATSEPERETIRNFWGDHGISNQFVAMMTAAELERAGTTTETQSGASLPAKPERLTVTATASRVKELKEFVEDYSREHLSPWDEKTSEVLSLLGQSETYYRKYWQSELPEEEYTLSVLAACESAQETFSDGSFSTQHIAKIAEELLHDLT